MCYGVCTRAGCEIAVHSLRRFAEREDGTRNIIVKIDFHNAFNCVRRDVALSKVKEEVPALYRQAYQPTRGTSITISSPQLRESNREIPLAHSSSAWSSITWLNPCYLQPIYGTLMTAVSQAHQKQYWLTFTAFRQLLKITASPSMTTNANCASWDQGTVQFSSNSERQPRS